MNRLISYKHKAVCHERIGQLKPSASFGTEEKKSPILRNCWLPFAVRAVPLVCCCLLFLFLGTCYFLGIRVGFVTSFCWVADGNGISYSAFAVLVVSSSRLQLVSCWTGSAYSYNIVGNYCADNDTSLFNAILLLLHLL